jgi:predicted ATPase
MLNRLDLNKFKCFEILRLPLAPLTLLSGSNASGKSSVLQALVLLHQTMRQHEWSNRLMLNGDSLRLGTVTDVVDKVNGRQMFEIGVDDNETYYSWTFAGERPDMSMAVHHIAINAASFVTPDSLRYLLPPNVDGDAISFANRMRGMTYITAERVGPREVYALEDRQISTVVGPSGEHAVSVLHWGRDKEVISGLVLTAVPPTRLRQVEERMRMFFPGCAIDVQQIPQTNAVTLGIRTSPDTDFHRPVHVGFGLTQVLPIIIAALSASVGEILLVENPEVHLHPSGQALMGQFLADVARAGVQVIVESHSDHVLNGIRRSVRSGRITPEQVAIHFFRQRTTDAAQVISPTIDSSGNIDAWPDGFFDQFDKDTNYFAGWGG